MKCVKAINDIANKEVAEVKEKEENADEERKKERKKEIDTKGKDEKEYVRADGMKIESHNNKSNECNNQQKSNSGESLARENRPHSTKTYCVTITKSAIFQTTKSKAYRIS